MAQIGKHHQHVGNTYDQSGLVTYGFDYELERLEKHQPVEYAITKRYLQRYIPDGATVVDVGAGVGHYSELLAKRGCKIHLVDVAERLLATAKERLVNAGLEGQLLGVHHASATDLSFLADDCCDVVLLLGPLYHLDVVEERQQALAEATRILRPGGLLFAAGINRMTWLNAMFNEHTNEVLEQRDFFMRYIHDGRFYPPDLDSPGYVYLATIEGFRAEFSAFTQLVYAGVESFANYDQKTLLKADLENAEVWLDLVEQTGTTLEGLGMTGHFLYIGRSKESAKE